MIIYACRCELNVSQVARDAAAKLVEQAGGEVRLLGPDEAVGANGSGKCDVVIDGCKESCAARAMERAGAAVFTHIVVTDLDIPVVEGKPAAQAEVTRVVVKASGVIQ